jgi:Tfp pilus assembly protein PilF
MPLDNQNTLYWQNLASIYRQLIGVVDGAPDWSYQSYQQALAFDPTNPMLSLDMGGLLFSAGKYSDAERAFETVAMNKSDYANGWYNWAYAAKQQGKLDVAVQRLAQAVALVPIDSGDYDKASKELDVWKKEYNDAVKKQQAQQQQQKAPETLNAPALLPTGTKEEKVNVPAADLQPPALIPTVAVQATPTPTKAAP